MSEEQTRQDTDPQGVQALALTSEHILAMQAGPAMDELLGTVIMGWKRQGEVWVLSESAWEDPEAGKASMSLCRMAEGPYGWRPSTEWAGAGDILDKLWEKGWDVMLNRMAFYGGNWMAGAARHKHSNGWSTATADEGPLAIARLALLVESEWHKGNGGEHESQ